MPSIPGPETTAKTDQSTTSTRPEIEADDPDLTRVLDKMQRVLLAANVPPFLFRYRAEIVELIKDDSNALTARKVTAYGFRNILGRCMMFSRSRKSGKVALIQVPLDLARALLAEPDLPFPVLAGITRTPIFRPDGTVTVGRGYDTVTGYYVDLDREFERTEPRRAQSSQEEAAAAAQFLDGFLFSDFPFADRADKANAYAYLLTAFLRPTLIGLAPAYLVESPTPGTGKSLLARMCALVATGTEPAMMLEPSGSLAWRLDLPAALRSGIRVLLIDNVGQALKDRALAAVLTGHNLGSRTLKSSDFEVAANRVVFVITANNPAVSREIDRRVLRIRLDAQVEDPARRKGFSLEPLDEWVYHYRADLLEALITMTKAWYDAKAPAPVHARPFGSFEAYREMVGGILEYAGVEGFLVDRTDQYAPAVEGADEWGEFFAAWWCKFGDHRVTADELLEIARDHLPAIEEFAGSEHGTKSTLGRKLRGFQGTIHDGRRLDVAGKNRKHATEFRLIAMESSEIADPNDGHSEPESNDPQTNGD